MSSVNFLQELKFVFLGIDAFWQMPEFFGRCRSFLAEAAVFWPERGAKVFLAVVLVISCGCRMSDFIVKFCSLFLMIGRYLKVYSIEPVAITFTTACA